MNQIYQKFNQLQMVWWEKGDWQGDRDSMTRQSKVDPSLIFNHFCNRFIENLGNYFERSW